MVVTEKMTFRTCCGSHCERNYYRYPPETIDMKKLLNTALIVINLIQPLQAADLSLLIENITDQRGTLYLSVFDSAQDYQADTRALLAAKSRVESETLRLTLHDLPPGQYVIKLFHDANDNGELDTNLLGIPQEGYGFSNNTGRFGPPSFEEASVTVNNDIQTTIRLR